MGTCYSRQAQLIGTSLLPPPATPSSLIIYDSVLDSPTHSQTDLNMPHPTQTADPAAPTRSQLTFGFKKPYSGRGNTRPGKNSNECSGKDNGRTVLGTLHNGRKDQPSPGGKQQPALRFGYKPAGRKDKVTKEDVIRASDSSESVQSASGQTNDFGLGVATAGVPRSASFPVKQSSFKRAFVPRSNTGSWKMIDDSLSSQMSSKAGSKAAVSGNGAAMSAEDLCNGNTDTAQSTPIKHATVAALQAQDRAPIAAVESLETLSGGSNDDTHSRVLPTTSTVTNSQSKKPTIALKPSNTNVSKLQSRLKAPFKKASNTATKETQVQGNHSNHQQTKGNHADSWVKATSESPQAKTTSKTTSKTGKGASFLRRGFLRKQKTTEEKSSPPKTVPTSASETQDSPSDKHSSTANNTTFKEKYDEEPKDVCESKEEEEPILSQVFVDEIIPEVVPTASASAPLLDTAETTSIGSIHSDDLMLDMEIDLNLEEYEELGSARVVERSKHIRSRSRSGSRSRSRDKLDPRSPGSASALDKCSVERRAGVGRTDTQVTHRKSEELTSPAAESLDELASLVELSSGGASLRRQQRYQRAARPASFPGPHLPSHDPASVTMDRETPGSRGGSVVLKPPRQGSFRDEEQITIDGFTYRQLVQDVTTFKTMLLKLKRLIQQEEFQGQSCKNGYKLGGSSQPNSPYDDSGKFSFLASLDAEDGLHDNSRADDSTMEMTEIRQQVTSLQQQVEERDRTITLLQQQMTKYECGYSEPGGKAYSNVAVQTDKVSGFYKTTGVYRTACARRTSSSSSQPGGATGSSRLRPDTRMTDQTSESVTPTDEVFLDLGSCDLEDDLDLLMEDVSLGGDSFSLNGGSFRGSSVSSPSRVDARDPSLPGSAVSTPNRAMQREHLLLQRGSRSKSDAPLSRSSSLQDSPAMSPVTSENRDCLSPVKQIAPRMTTPDYDDASQKRTKSPVSNDEQYNLSHYRSLTTSPQSVSGYSPVSYEETPGRTQSPASIVSAQSDNMVLSNGVMLDLRSLKHLESVGATGHLLHSPGGSSRSRSPCVLPSVSEDDSVVTGEESVHSEQLSASRYVLQKQPRLQAEDCTPEDSTRLDSTRLDMMAGQEVSHIPAGKRQAKQRPPRPKFIPNLKKACTIDGPPRSAETRHRQLEAPHRQLEAVQPSEQFNGPKDASPLPTEASLKSRETSSRLSPLTMLTAPQFGKNKGAPQPADSHHRRNLSPSNQKQTRNLSQHSKEDIQHRPSPVPQESTKHQQEHSSVSHDQGKVHRKCSPFPYDSLTDTRTSKEHSREAHRRPSPLPEDIPEEGVLAHRSQPPGDDQTGLSGGRRRRQLPSLLSMPSVDHSSRGVPVLTQPELRQDPSSRGVPILTQPAPRQLRPLSSGLPGPSHIKYNPKQSSLPAYSDKHSNPRPPYRQGHVVTGMDVV